MTDPTQTAPDPQTATTLAANPAAAPNPATVPAGTPRIGGILVDADGTAMNAEDITALIGTLDALPELRTTHVDPATRTRYHVEGRVKPITGPPHLRNARVALEATVTADADGVADAEQMILRKLATDGHTEETAEISVRFLALPGQPFSAAELRALPTIHELDLASLGYVLGEGFSAALGAPTVMLGLHVRGEIVAMFDHGPGKDSMRVVRVFCGPDLLGVATVWHGPSGRGVRAATLSAETLTQAIARAVMINTGGGMEDIFEFGTIAGTDVYAMLRAAQDTAAQHAAAQHAAAQHAAAQDTAAGASAGE